MTELLDLLLHVDQYLLSLAATYGPWIYAILFLIVFAETGLVVTPFLPGDSLLFAAGALSASGSLDVRVATLSLLVAAIAGDAVNYTIGRHAGERLIARARTDPRWGRWINPAYVEHAHVFRAALFSARFWRHLETLGAVLSAIGGRRGAKITNRSIRCCLAAAGRLHADHTLAVDRREHDVA